MKQLIIPRFTAISIGLFLTAGVILFSTIACSSSKPGCGSKHDHKVRAKKVKKMAPSMTM